MSASLASAMMNSRQLGSAWIAASLRSSDFFMASALPLPCPEMVTRELPGRAIAARRRPSSPATGEIGGAVWAWRFGRGGGPPRAWPACALGLLL